MFRAFECIICEQKRFITILASAKGVVIGFVPIHAFMAIPVSLQLLRGPQPCHDSASNDTRYAYIINSTLMFICLSIVVVYLVVIVRILKKKKVSDHVNASATEVHKQKLIRSIWTLGMIIVITLAAVLPRPASTFYMTTQTEANSLKVYFYILF